MKYPKHYSQMRKRYRRFFSALERLGSTARASGPLDEKTSHLLQLAAAAAIRSEGAVHSHARRALQAGASAQELEHALLLITSTVGFPTMAAAMSWLQDVLKEAP
jgi:alkylhydroperoxidase/carboxymuconolactone decarboxylase family protein YurZ